MDTKGQMLVAKNLIQQKRYEEARAVLKTIQHPTAQKWLVTLDRISPEKKTAPPKRRRWWLIAGGIVAIYLACAVIYYATERSQTPELVSYINRIKTSQATVCNASFIDGLRDPNRYKICIDISTNFSGCANQARNTAEVLTCLSSWEQDMCSLIHLGDEAGKAQCLAKASATATANSVSK
jgi:hypothetical protein